MKIDLTDKKLLYELHMNARAPLSELSKIVKLSKQAVAKRIENLEKEGIIKQYFSLIDIHKLGYTFYRLDVKLQNTDLEKEKEIIDFLLRLPKTIWVAELHGNWDIAILFLTNNLVEVDENIRKIKWTFDEYIKEDLFSISTTHSRYHYSFLLEKQHDESGIFMGREYDNQKLSEIEKKVLKSISVNARQSLVDIGKKTNIPLSTIKRTIDGLKKKKILLGFATLIDIEKLDLELHKLLINFKNPTNTKEKRLEEYFQNHPKYVFLTKSLGKTDTEVQVVVKDSSELKELIQELKEKQKEIIKSIESETVIKEYKTDYYPV